MKILSIPRLFLLVSCVMGVNAYFRRLSQVPQQRRVNSVIVSAGNPNIEIETKAAKKVLSSILFGSTLFCSILVSPLPSPYQNQIMSVPSAAAAAEVEQVLSPSGSVVKKVQLFTKRSNDLQAYSDISRGFKILRPFGWNEFEGAGGGYLVKFSSLFDVDENIVVGSTASSADKTSIADYGTLEDLGKKFASKRNGELVSSLARETEGILFYQFEFSTPVDASLPRPKNSRPNKGIELYELCVSKGRLWSVKATSNDVLFPSHEQTLRAALASFIPRL